MSSDAPSSSGSDSSPMSPSKWTEQELRQRITMLEKAVVERNTTIEKLQRDLRVATSKARIVDEVMAECKVLRARLATAGGGGAATTGEGEQQQKQASTSSASSETASKDPEIERLRRQLNEGHAPSPLQVPPEYMSSPFPSSVGHDLISAGGGGGDADDEEAQIQEVMDIARDAVRVETAEERLLRERLENLMKKK